VRSVGSISLRPVGAEDARLLFEWRNNPEIVRLGSSQREVTWPEHEKWFLQSIGSDERCIFIVERDGLAIGQVRFDLARQSECVISVYLANEFTGRGWGIEAITSACEEIFKRWPIGLVLAQVRIENNTGQSAFRKAGFHEVDGESMPGHRTFQLMRQTT
jgi:UDP-2,4-diacetamido-2,4,6-trideoxy-beta-L-altropyranose hydrolase